MGPARGATRIFMTFCAGIGMMLGPANSSAQPGILNADLARCAAITADTVRLACFDALAREPGSQSNAERASPEPAVAESTEATLETAGNDNAFGAELIGGSRAQGPDRIENRLVGEFTGWRGNTTFTLENGQVWRQAEDGRLSFRSDSPLVTIRRGAFGTYRLTVEGVNRAVRVRRIE